MNIRCVAFFASLLLIRGPTAYSGTSASPGVFHVTNGEDDGAGSLRSAIRDAAPQSTIDFAFSGIVQLTSGELTINRDLTITGPGATKLDIRGGHSRILNIAPATRLNLSGVTVSNGHPDDAPGAAILNKGTLYLDGVRVRDSSPNPITFLLPAAVNGGGCLNASGATMFVNNCSFSGNRCTQAGGAVSNAGNLTISNSTISGNVAGYGGGVSSSGTLTMVNCTVEGNSAITTGPHGLQGGYSGGLSVGGLAQLTSVTICRNHAAWSGGGISTSSAAVRNCIIAANIADVHREAADIGGVVQSGGYNLVGIASAANGLTTQDSIGDQNSPLDAKLGPLQDNGGPTKTVALLPGSPALDHGSNESLATTDQRGMPRTFEQSAVTNSPGGNGTDVGAFELDSSIATYGNISTRLSIGTGDNALIGGFIITGTAPKKVVVRGIGPSLPLAEALADPIIEVHGSAGELLATDDNWNDDPTNAQHLIEAGLAPTNALESARWGIINPGAYTIVVRGKNNATGVGLFEVYDLDRTADSKLANISTRGFVDTGDNVMIGGTIIIGSTPTSVLVRAIGPSLANFGVQNALPNPTLELHDGNGALLESNDNWRSDHEAEIIATGLPPTNELESAILRTLPPGAYTAIVRGGGNTTGVALVEAYQLH
jgi:hypothetical protein